MLLINPSNRSSVMESRASSASGSLTLPRKNALRPQTILLYFIDTIKMIPKPAVENEDSSVHNTLFHPSYVHERCAPGPTGLDGVYCLSH